MGSLNNGWIYGLNRLYSNLLIGGRTMAHMTNKKRLKKAKNDLMRGYNPKPTGTITMKTNKDYKRIKNFEKMLDSPIYTW